MRNLKLGVTCLFAFVAAGCAQQQAPSQSNVVTPSEFNLVLDQNYQRAMAIVIDQTIGNVKKIDQQIVIQLKGDHSFAYNSSEVLPEGKLVLKQLSALLVDLPKSQVFIGGHTDSSGSDEYNKKLSMQRAESVALFFINQGVDEARVGAFGFGEKAPISDNATRQGREENRRIELRITPKI